MTVKTIKNKACQTFSLLKSSQIAKKGNILNSMRPKASLIKFADMNLLTNIVTLQRYYFVTQNVVQY